MAKKGHSGIVGAGELVRRLRLLNEWTLDELAIRLGTSKSALCSLENNGRPITISMIERMALQFKISPEELLVRLYKRRKKDG
jgi:transcriptional regulator with XRE-family HTH domain